MTIYFHISITNRVLEAMLVSAVTAAVAFGGTMLLGECKELPTTVCTSMSLVKETENTKGLNRRKTINTMTKRTGIKRQTLIYETLHRRHKF